MRRGRPEKLGDLAVGNHLTLRVDLDRPYLAEVGVADAIIEPVPLAVGSISQRGFDFSIVPVEGGWLRFKQSSSRDCEKRRFSAGLQRRGGMAATQDWLMRDPGSPFTNALAVFRHTADGYVALQNDCLRHVTASGVSEQRITSADHLADTFETVFKLDIPRPRRCRREFGPSVRRGRLNRVRVADVVGFIESRPFHRKKSAQDRQNGKRRTMIASSEKLPGPRRTSSRKHVAQTPCVGQASG
ncbi:arylamine N-acetyltransferase [Ancylobacter oerskovii]|uniref:Arylamine N-acetyltransferase n=1 Tax=Ancylobacter oerskovii TaxID=459519 RepID=A0ABW4Z668_9HYPH